MFITWINWGLSQYYHNISLYTNVHHMDQLGIITILSQYITVYQCSSHGSIRDYHNIVTIYHCIPMFITWINWGLSQYYHNISQSTIEIPINQDRFYREFWIGIRGRRLLCFFAAWPRILTPVSSRFGKSPILRDISRYIEIYWVSQLAMFDETGG